jgi:hypothetical protein
MLALITLRTPYTTNVLTGKLIYSLLDLLGGLCSHQFKLNAIEFLWLTNYVLCPLMSFITDTGSLFMGYGQLPSWAVGVMSGHGYYKPIVGWHVSVTIHKRSEEESKKGKKSNFHSIKYTNCKGIWLWVISILFIATREMPHHWESSRWLCVLCGCLYRLDAFFTNKFQAGAQLINRPQHT